VAIMLNVLSMLKYIPKSQVVPQCQRRISPKWCKIGMFFEHIPLMRYDISYDLSNTIISSDLGVAPSGDCLRGEGLVWLIWAVVCLLAAATGPMSISAGSG